jgi:hypothetical protein
MADARDTVVYSEKVDTATNCPTGVPFSLIRNRFGSSGAPPPSSRAFRSHRFCNPIAHHWHLPQPATHKTVT